MNDDKALDGSTPEFQIDYWRHRALKAEIALEDLKDVGRAKMKLIHDLGWTEPQAHRYIQQTAMETRRSMGALARDLIKGLVSQTQPGETAANNG
jgi:AmiR/NasT family two-component response regulator